MPEKRKARLPRAIQSKAKPLVFIAGAAVSLICLYLVFRKINWAEFRNELLTMPLLIVLTAVILANIHNFVLAKRWHLLLKPLGKLGFWDAFWSLRISFFFNATLPARLGEPFRVFYIHRYTPISVARTVGAMGADRLLDFVTMCVLLYLSAVVLGIRGTLPTTRTLLMVAVASGGLLFALGRLPHQSRWKWLNKLLQLRKKIFEGATTLVKIETLLSTIPISFVGWVIEALIVVALSYGVDTPISLYKAFMVVAGVTLTISIPSTPGHIGTFELGAIAMLRFFKIPAEQAATIAILYHMVQLISTLIIGAYGYNRHFLHRKPITATATQ